MCVRTTEQRPVGQQSLHTFSPARCVVNSTHDSTTMSISCNAKQPQAAHTARVGDSLRRATSGGTCNFPSRSPRLRAGPLPTCLHLRARLLLYSLRLRAELLPHSLRGQQPPNYGASPTEALSPLTGLPFSSTGGRRAHLHHPHAHTRAETLSVCASIRTTTHAAGCGSNEPKGAPLRIQVVR